MDHVENTTGSIFAHARPHTLASFGEEPCREVLVLAALIQEAAGGDPTPYLEKYIYSQQLYAVFRPMAEKYLGIYVTGTEEYEKGYLDV